MTRLRSLLLACAIVPLSHLALQTTASAKDGGFILAQAGPPACQPGDPDCVPPEKMRPRQEKPSEAPPEAAAPKDSPAPEKHVQPERPTPGQGVLPEPPVSRKEAVPERPASPQLEVKPEAPAPSKEAEPKPLAPKEKAPEVAPETVMPNQEGQSGPSAPKPEAKPDHSKVKPEARPEPDVSTPEPAIKAPISGPKAHPGRPAPKPEARQPDGVAAPAEATTPKPEAKPGVPAPEPAAQPAPVPAPIDSPDKSAPPPVIRDGAAAQDAPAPLDKAGMQPPTPPDAIEGQAPPPALIEKLANPGSAAAKAIDRSVDEKASDIHDIQRERRIISNDNGVQVTVEPGGRVIVQSGDEAVIRHDDRARFGRHGQDYRERQTRDGGREVIVTTRDGDEIHTLYDPNGMIVQRERRDQDGNVHVLFDNRRDGRGRADEPAWQQPIVRLPPPVFDLPRDRYRVEMRSAPSRYVEEALTAPPVVEVQPRYTLDQVIYSPDLRERVRSVDLDTITFSSGAWGVERSQVASLDAVARGIDAALRRNPNEVFLVEGYTDAVGSVVDNLSLSDRRAEAVANILTDNYGIPPENLVTQGYGESYLKVQTEGAERANRRVTVRRITPLLATKGEQ